MGRYMDIGGIGNEKIVFKRQFRWALYLGGGVEAWMCHVTSRPTLNLGEQEINHMHEKHYISGKPTWDTISMTVYDVMQSNQYDSPFAEISQLHKWLHKTYMYPDIPDVGGFQKFEMGSWDEEYKEDLTLKLYDGHGNTMETWWLLGAYPTTANFGGLDYGNADVLNIEMTIRYDRATYFYGDAKFAAGGASGIA